MKSFLHKRTGISRSANLNRLSLCWVVGFIMASFTAFPVPANAHRVNVFAWVEDDTVQVECKFPGGRPVNEGRISVLDPQGHQLLEGETDEEGRFSFKIPQKTDLTVVLHAGMGHQAEWTVPVDEILEAMGERMLEPLEEQKASRLSAESSRQDKTEKAPSGEIGPALTKEEMQGLIEEVLDRKLEPVKKMIVQSHESGPTVTEIVGGIGYIFGLLGVAAYFASRRKRDQ